MQNENQKFDVLVDGVLKTAEVLKIFELDDKKYAMYSVDLDNDFSDVFVSEVVQDQEGNDILQDIEDESVKNNIIELANIMFS